MKKSSWLISLLLVMGLILSACGGDRPELPEAVPAAEESSAEESSTEAEAEATEAPAEEMAEADADMDGDSLEAPMLAEMVAAGSLPPLADRLPSDPMVVEVVESIGKHGGTWRRVFKGIKDFHAFGRLNYDPVLRWPRDPKDGVQPGLAHSWDWSDDGTEMTLHFREGMKWSDGEPFTSADVLFWWEDIENDENITPAVHAEWVVAGEPMTVEAPDDTTVVLKFAAPNGLAEAVGLAFHGHQWPLGFERFGFFAPRHYLEQFHPKYNTDLNDYSAFEDAAFDFNTERPVMTPWKITEWEAGATEMVAVRNPYYWKVDAEGKQLPYIDELHYTLVEDNEAANILALAGDIDMQSRHMDFAKAPVFQEQSEAGEYSVGLWSSANASHLTFFPNQSYDDPQYRALMEDLNFRKALSLGLNRDLMNEIAYFGQATPRTLTVVDASPYFQEDIVSLNAELDPDAAMALLDEMGLPLDDDGFRTFEDGTPIELIIETSNSGSGLDMLELAIENWNDIGLRSTLSTMTRDVYWPKATSNQVMIATWGTDRGLVPMVDPIYQFPFDERSWMGPAFGIWYKSQGELGEEPNAAFAEAMALYDQYRGSVDGDEQTEIAKQLVRMSTENLWTIGTVGMAPGLVIVKDDFKNVIADQSFVADWIIMAPGTQDPSQYYFDR